MPNIIREFRGEYSWMSNFAPYGFNDGKRTWPTVEHYYQACKADRYEDFNKIINAGTPSVAKKLGSQIHLRPDWDLVKYKAMLYGVTMKIQQNSELIGKLIATGDSEIIEGNYWHDNYWGRCYCPKCANKEGSNYLGKILMFLRDIR
jgi:ribA/ribD-fused uncharacterized protein